MRTLSIAFLLASATASAAQPFFTFAMESTALDPATIPVVARYFTSQDYLGRRAVTRNATLIDVVPISHQIQFSSDIQGIQQYVQRGCSPQTPGVFFYHFGEPGKTPANETADPVGSVARAAAVAHTGCNRFGLIPEGSFFGINACAATLANAPYQRVDWTAVDYVDITLGGLLRDDCMAHSSVANYVSLVKTIAATLRASNPKMVIAAHLSFRETPPEVMRQAVEGLTAVVDGFWLAYPMNSREEHRYCTAQNLETLLSAVRARP